MEWFRMHPYAAGALGAAVFLVLGAFVVAQRTAVTPRAGTTAWGGTGIPLLDPSSYTPQQEPALDERDTGPVLKTAPYIYTPQKARTQDDGQASGISEFDSFVRMLQQASGATQPQGSASAGTEAYAFIPRGFISTSTATEQRTQTQQTLYDYGNNVGSYIQSFEERNPNMVQALKNQLEDRFDAEKIAAVHSIALGMQRLGESIANMDDVPKPVATAHANLAASYIDAGTKLDLVPKAQSTEDMLAAIGAYNNAADLLVTRFVTLVNYFSAYGVLFGPQDPGSIFVFNPLSFQ